MLIVLVAIFGLTCAGIVLKHPLKVSMPATDPVGTGGYAPPGRSAGAIARIVRYSVY